MNVSWDVWVSAIEADFLEYVIVSKYWLMFPQVRNQNFSSLFCSSQV